VSFSKTSNSTRPSDSCYFEVFEKLTRACYIQIALETILLPILNNEILYYSVIIYFIRILFHNHAMLRSHQSGFFIKFKTVNIENYA
jgi:hypothetical protein